ncbi:Ftsk gamma domain-containing protein [Paenibacillus sophorae]|uniref:Ftsk gamma domain-containing protein n=1 Tax=Paenibacillus sophorae TaxID=1333845 RepID=A0A1H8GRU7_9BACL|nr:hypothetical protein [Paenibacillus sophorae]QWU14323.1 hypothetical protein KP014_20670 [Paenibacillus sophorae]SEN46831.1 Ftsk gamma domain-containing protein [Paenibacillus sophorae]
MIEFTQEYMDNSIDKSDLIYEQVVNKAIQNGTITYGWINRVFGLNWYASMHIMQRMEDEGLCSPYDGNLRVVYK